ncbi:hypothetical protein [Marinobacter sp.]|jgi:DNA-binding helix-hairpin-helix protein with protein kinase domain|uniref:hypothetical protein n=1 Tax=Marinobacter sp. TaxID=50741 RepID=UPI0019B42288|nr:hypothetical protein [Marinobacter sp.]MBC7193842.1 hypothetical protein [Marinobacter sp.]
MTKLSLQLLIGDAELQAIGHVAAQWAYFETEMDSVIELLELHESQSNNEKSDPQAFNRRIKKLRSLASDIFQGNPLSELLEILEKVSSLKKFRDDIVHGHWQLYRKNDTLTTGIAVVKRRPEYSRKKFKFTAEKAEDIAAKISEQTLKLTLWHSKYIHIG